MNRLIEIAVNRYRIVLFFIVLATIPFTYFYIHQHYLNSIDVFFEKNNPDIQYYKDFQKQFGNDEIVAIVFKSKDIFSKTNVEIIKKLTTSLQSFEKIQRVMSLTEVEIATGHDNIVEFEKLFPPGEKLTDKGLEHAKQKALRSDVIPGSLISEDCTTTAIIIELRSISSIEIKSKVLAKIRQTADRIAGDSVELKYSGGPFLEVEINDLTSRDNTKFTPITFFIIIFIVYYMLKSKLLSLLGQINIIVILLWGIGFLIMCGESINSVTVVIAPVLLAISIADTIHILSNYQERYSTGRVSHKDAVLKTVKSLWVPCLFTSITTGIGYLSFVTTSVRAVKIVGIFTAAGVMLAFFMTIFLLPAILMLFSNRIQKSAEDTNVKQPQTKKSLLDPVLSSISHFTVNHYFLVTIIFVLVTLIIGMGMSQLEFDTNFVSYLKKNNPIKQDIVFIENNIRGTVPVELIIDAKTSDHDFTHPSSLKLIETIQKMVIEHMDGRYTTSFSAADYFKEVNRAFNNGNETFFSIPAKRIDLLDYYETGDADVLDRLISADRTKARISFASRFGSTKKSKKFTRYLETTVSELLGDNYSYKFTGLSALYLKMDANLKSSQIRSFGTAFVLIFGMMFFVCKNIKLAILSMIPNIFPIAVTLGIMGWFHIPLDSSTIMIASVTIGIAVDDTIHFITWFRRNSLTGMQTPEALKKTFIDTGRPIIMTSVVLCVAYFVLITGSVKPIIAFGALAGLAMFFALIGDLFILPAIIMIFKPEFTKKEMIDDKADRPNVFAGVID